MEAVDRWRSRRGARWHSVAALLSEPVRGVELGVKEGRFSTYLLERFPKLHMIGVDLCRPRKARERTGYETYDDWNWQTIMRELELNTESVRDRFELLQMSTVDAADFVGDGSCDFVFIDAEHTYEGVRDDIMTWRSKVRPGGILCGHDYNPNLPRMAGVIRAVDEFAGPVKTAPDVVWWTRC